MIDCNRFQKSITVYFWTVRVVLSTFSTAQTIDLPTLFMGAVIGIAPIIVIFFIVQRYIVEGVEVTGIKG